MAVIFTIQASAQKKVEFDVDISYLYGLQERTDYGNFSRNDYKMSGASLHFSVLHPFSEAFAAGAGIGLDRYNHPGYNTCPVFLTVHYSPITSFRNAYLFADAGKDIGSSDFSKGTMLDAGIGYKYMTGKRFGITFRLGYNIRWSENKTKYEMNGKYSNYADMICVNIDEIYHVRHSVVAGLGVIF